MTQSNRTTPDGTNDTSSKETVFDQLLREEHDDQMHYAALYYAHLGLPVFPVAIKKDDRGKESKTPCIKDWPNNATTDEHQVNRWWGPNGQFMGSMVGVQTGHRSGWGVIDVDCKNGGKGFESLRLLADEIVPLATSTELAFGMLAPELRLAPSGLVRTRSGGLHLWYRLGDFSKTRGKNKIRGLPGLEFKASGQYVVAAPSAGYEWLKYLPAEREVGEIDAKFLATCPVINERLLARLKDGTEPGAHDTDYDDDDETTRYIVKGNGRQLLDETRQAVTHAPFGFGNSTIYTKALDVYPYVVLGEMTKAEVDDGFMNAASLWEDEASESSITTTLNSAWNRTHRRTFKFTTDAWPAGMNGSGGESMDEDEVVDSPVETLPNGHYIVDGLMNSQPNGEAGDEEELPDVGPTGGPLEEFIALLPDDMKDHVTNRTAVYNDVVGRYQRAVGREVYEQLSDPQHSWLPADLGDDESDPVPTVLKMTDGRALIYPNEKNMVWGMASAGKSWLAYLAIVEQVKLGRHTILFDYENGKKRIRSRLRWLGLTAEEIKEYVHVYLGQSGAIPVRQMPVDLDQIGITVTDSYTGALAAMDLNAKDTGDIEVFCRRNVTPFTDAGAAVFIIDHVTKDDTTHDRPINSAHKLNRVQGAGYQLINTVPFHPGQVGWSQIRLWKDNSGSLDWTRGDDVGWLKIDGRCPDRVEVTIGTEGPQLSELSTATSGDAIKVAKLISDLDEAGIPRGLSVVKTREAMKLVNLTANQEILALAVKERKSG